MAAGGGNSGRYLRLALAIAAGRPIGDAAREAGLSDRSASRAMRRPKFTRMVRRVQAEMRQRVVGRLADSCTEAVDSLLNMVRTAPPTARVAAAKALLDHSSRWSAEIDLADRIAALERAAAEAGRAKVYST